MTKNNKVILGISAFYHDSAAAILVNGEIVAAAQEERFTRKKHDRNFPVNAINFCLAEAFIEMADVDLVVFYDNPLLTLDRIIKNGIYAGEDGRRLFENSIKSNLSEKVWVADFFRLHFKSVGKLNKVLFAGHHISHLASSFYPSPFDEALLISIDGVGEWATTTIARGFGSNIEIIKQINYPHSLGLLYSAFTSYCGFKVNSGEYKLMGLAPYGVPKYKDIIYNNLIDVKSDGSYRLNLDFFGYLTGEKSTNDQFHNLFGGPPRLSESHITRKEMDLAASIQSVTEDIVLQLVKHAKETTGLNRLCLSGGVALNCVANGKIYKSGLFEDIWIQPAAGDAGGALGACYVGHHLFFKESRKQTTDSDSQKGSYLGNSYSVNQIRSYLDRSAIPYHFYKEKSELNVALAKEIAEGKIVGYFNGRMEFGPRALGSRSIIGDARNTEMQSKMNIKIKYRESFRPFAPLVLEDDVADYFDYQAKSPYMLMVANVREELLRNQCSDSVDLRDDNNDNMIDKINQIRSTIPSVTHVDNSARLQTVSKVTNPDLHDLMLSFKKLTGVSVLINTSFNVRGEPIVCTPMDAYLCFMRTEIDILVLENFILLKEEQPKLRNDENWKAKFELD